MGSKHIKSSTIVDFLIISAKEFPDKTGLIFEDRSYSYQELLALAKSVAAFVVSKTNKGDVVGLLLHNSPEFVFAYFGILLAGCTVLLMPASISDESFAYQVKKTSPKIIISEDSYKSKFKRLALGQLKVVDIREITMQKISECDKNRLPTPTDVSTIIFTSGTTSEPKGVKLTHSNVVNATKNISSFLGWREQDIDLNISPLSHSFGLGHLHCSFAASGTTILFRDAVNLKKILVSIISSKATTFAAVPAILRLIRQSYQTELIECCKSLRFIQTNTSPLEPELINSLLQTVPKTDFNYYYGLSEASRSSFISFNKNPDKLGSVGRATPGVDVKIMDANDQVVPPGEIGEICIKGRHVISEYWQNPEASKKIRDGFLHTGDVGYLDKDGFLFFRGREDDIINISGEKVAPEEIETAVKKIAGVEDAAAIGVPDRLLGEVVCVCLVIGKEYNRDSFLKECRGLLEGYKVPRRIEIVKAIPRTENGKTQRNKIKEMIRE